ncbi:MAG: tryptophan 2,3-dioxygenase [Bdellovibrio sp.]|nr:MAG: tryptophan 2,3-dioxygenase [Bdellovibrio sp.]
MKEKPPVHYISYLKIDELLSLQKPLSFQTSHPCHDEMLFIITHQVYELWFKQILFEVDRLLNIFRQPKISETNMGTIVSSLRRITEIQKVLIQQINILETMTPLDFLDFRNLIFPASGFQSFQFRVLENKLGLKESMRLSYNDKPYHAHFSEEKAKELQKLEQELSLFEGVDHWLARTPFLQIEDFNFWELYKHAVRDLFNQEKETLLSHPHLSEDDKTRNLKIIENNFSSFEALFDENKYQELRKKGVWRLSYKAVHAALLIQLYREQPVFQMPFQIITELLNMDELMTQWRYRHALLARRMLGTKMGTGGSSGSAYLQASAEQHKLFNDLFQLTTFFIPKTKLPPLPKNIEKQMGFSSLKS